VSAAVWVQSIRPYGSGLAITSGVLLLHVRIYTSFLSQPYDAIDPNVLAATSALIVRIPVTLISAATAACGQLTCWGCRERH